MLRIRYVMFLQHAKSLALTNITINIHIFSGILQAPPMKNEPTGVLKSA